MKVCLNRKVGRIRKELERLYLTFMKSDSNELHENITKNQLTGSVCASAPNTSKTSA